jgi:hypothetical protein
MVDAAPDATEAADGSTCVAMRWRRDIVRWDQSDDLSALNGSTLSGSTLSQCYTYCTALLYIKKQAPDSLQANEAPITVTRRPFI